MTQERSSSISVSEELLHLLYRRPLWNETDFST